MPKKLPLLTVTATEGDGVVGGTEGCAFLIGFDIDMARMQGGELHLTNRVEAFREELYGRAANQNLVTEQTQRHLRVKCSSFDSWKELPAVVLEVGMGGRAAAKAERKRILERRKREAAAAAVAAEAAAAAAAPRDENVEDGLGAGEGRKRALEGGEARDTKAQAVAAEIPGGGGEAHRQVVPVHEAPALDWLQDS
jgi:hypothetical protein